MQDQLHARRREIQALPGFVFQVRRGTVPSSRWKEVSPPSVIGQNRAKSFDSPPTAGIYSRRNGRVVDMIEIEFEEPVESICECCGQLNKQLSGTIYDGDELVAMYLTTLTTHPGLPVSVLVIWGDFENLEAQSARQAATMMIVRTDKGYSTGIVEPEQAGWDRTDIATFLSMDEALADFSALLFRVSDIIVQKDALVLEYLDRPVVTH
jgi:hypothetical protein